MNRMIDNTFERESVSGSLMKKRVFNIGKAFGCIGLGATMQLSLAIGFASGAEFDDSSSKSKAILVSLQDAFSTVADELEPAVVTVSSSKASKGEATADDEDGAKGTPPFNKMPRPFNRLPGRVIGTGSGVIIRKDGWILTNDHVVNGADRVTVKLHDGREFVGTVRRDFLSDLALVKIDSPFNFPTAKLGDSDRIKIGHWAVAIGSPYRYEGSFSVGVISSLFRRHIIQEGQKSADVRLYPNMIQTDAAINPGNSGGPLCNLDGEVIGINTAIESEGGGSIGIGFAIPINSAKFVIDQLIANGRVRYGRLGVSPKDVTPQTAKALGVSEGAWIENDPSRGSAGEKAGLKIGDVITAIDGKPVRNELDLRTLVSHTAPDTNVEIVFFRSGKRATTKAKIDEASVVEVILPKVPVKSPNRTRLGIDVSPLTDRLATNSRIGSGVSGVYVKSIDGSSAAGDIDSLSEGSVILQVNDTLTPTPLAFKDATSDLKQGDQIKLIFLDVRGLKTLRIIQVD